MPSEDIHHRPQEFRAALEFTAAETGFSSRLIEKDYWCSLILRELYADEGTPLVFKGGTLLSKAFAGFDRMSEDLDFTIPTGAAVKRSSRSKKAEQIKARLEAMTQKLGLRWTEEWRGHNNSTQHGGRLVYKANRGGEDGILIEVSQREEVWEGVERTPLQTLLLNPLFSEAVVPPITVGALSQREAYAEKVRAALTREEPAIRDLYDLRQGQRAGRLPLEDASWFSLVRRKCDGFDLTDACSETRFEQFRRGVETDLLPVLRSGAVSEFQFSEAWSLVKEIHQRLRT